MSRRTALLWSAAGTVVALAAAGTALGVLQPWRAAEADQPADEPVTAAVERTTLTSDLVLNGTLSYGDLIELPGRSGIVTRLPRAGDVIPIGQSLYEVDGAPVIAVRGDRPFWRPLSEGVPDGPDVRQLEEFLAVSGFAGDLTVDETFTWYTAQAVEAWQEATGQQPTGVVALGDVVAVDAEAVRVAAVNAKLGDPASQGPIGVTSTRLRVVARLTDAQARELLPATAVTVTLPDGTALNGAIASIDPGGQPVEDGGTTPASAVIDLDDPVAAEGIGLRAVKVAIPSTEAPDALVVPVVALVATLDGGYAVDVLRDGELTRVAVELGLIADARAQVVAGDLAEGDRVVIAR
ncbi:MAG: peptidoglycan-binding protein [Microbacteriaceae bacterium]|nr:peptidoglycan-binding protein [Microbacteriaceae bacterium]